MVIIIKIKTSDNEVIFAFLINSIFFKDTHI